MAERSLRAVFADWSDRKLLMAAVQCLDRLFNSRVEGDFEEARNDYWTILAALDRYADVLKREGVK